MANFKLKLTISFIIALFFCGSCFANDNIIRTKTENYDLIYDELEEADFNYLFGIDPKQADEYEVYMYSPYPLFRSGVTLIFKSLTIPPGYYLLTPREKDGKTYVLFKENGKVRCTIPVYREESVSETFYEEKFPHPIPTKFQKMKQKSMDYIGTKWGHKNQRTPIPKAYIDFSDKGVYWDMVLYYGTKKYFLLFKKEI